MSGGTCVKSVWIWNNCEKGNSYLVNRKITIPAIKFLSQ